MISKVKNALLSVSDNVFHYYANSETFPYIVWAEDSRKDVVGDNKHIEKIWQGTIDLYTKTENDELVDKIEDALSENDVVWELNSVQFESELGIIHFEWVWEV